MTIPHRIADRILDDISQDTFINHSRRQAEKQPGRTLYKALLGDGFGNVNDTTEPHKVWVRQVTSDAQGNETFFAPTLVQGWGGESYGVFDGARVEVGYNRNGELSVLGSDIAGEIQAGRNPAVLNYGDHRTKTWSLKQLGSFRSYPVAQTGANSLKVAVGKTFYRNQFGDVQIYPGAQIDLSSYIPTELYTHRLAALFMTEDMEIVVVASTPKSSGLPLDYTTDLAEIFDNAFANHMPIWAWKLEYGQVTITDKNSWQDLRPWFNVPKLWGFIDPVINTHLIQAGTSVAVFGGLKIDGKLQIEGRLRLPSNPGTLSGYVKLVEIDHTDSPYCPSYEDSVIVNTTGGNVNIYLPDIAMFYGRRYNFKNIGTGDMTLYTASGQTIDGAASLLSNIQYDSITIEANSLEWSII